MHIAIPCLITFLYLGWAISNWEEEGVLAFYGAIPLMHSVSPHFGVFSSLSLARTRVEIWSGVFFGGLVSVDQYTTLDDI